MNRFTIILAVTFLFAACSDGINHPKDPADQIGQEVSFFTPDSIQIFGDLYVQDQDGPTIFLFHQGGSNARGEYGPIIPRLTKKGYNILAIDQRVGGQYYGSYNRTLSRISNNHFGDGYGYCDALSNLESALSFVQSKGLSGRKILWGSSYSATLVIQFAATRPDDIIAVLAFSPASGTPMGECQPEPFLQSVSIPLLILKPQNEAESERGIEQIALANSLGHEVFVPTHGVHGSSMLVPERVGKDVEKSWEVVLDFLDRLDR
jgi:pimeloyl-ACP methyl ester carboxylesterase